MRWLDLGLVFDTEKGSCWKVCKDYCFNLVLFTFVSVALNGALWCRPQSQCSKSDILSPSLEVLLYCKPGKETKTFSTLLVYYLSQIKHVNYCRRGKLRLHIPLPVPYSASYTKKNRSNIFFKNMESVDSYSHIFENIESMGENMDIFLKIWFISLGYITQRLPWRERNIKYGQSLH